MTNNDQSTMPEIYNYGTDWSCAIFVLWYNYQIDAIWIVCQVKEFMLFYGTKGEIMLSLILWHKSQSNAIFK
jgi:hypothetical protein